MLEYKWGCIAVTDLRGLDGTLEFHQAGRSCALITHQRVGFLLDDVWTQWWQEGQSKLYPNGDRALGIQFPRRGWRRGLFLTTVYAPTSDSATGERQFLRDQMNQVLGMKESTSMTLVLGDFNAEMGNNRDPHQVGNIAMGPFGWPKTTVAGREWRSWAQVRGFRDCTSRYQLRHRTTWAHPGSFQNMNWIIFSFMSHAYGTWSEREFNWLDNPPTPEEVRRAINDMKMGKAPGPDMFMAEHLKFGGPTLRAEIPNLVRLIWSRAGAAEAGLETEQWPQAWTKGIVFSTLETKGGSTRSQYMAGHHSSVSRVKVSC